MRKPKITYDAPVTLSLSLAAVAVHVIGAGTGAAFAQYFVSHPQLGTTASYIGLVSHVLGHASWAHLLGNFSLILLLGPMLEKRYGKLTFAAMIATTALTTGLINALFLHELLLGASGIVFMCILLTPLATSRACGEIPLTFITVALLFLGGEVAKLTAADSISHGAHLLGGVAGAAWGFALARRGSKLAPQRAVAGR